MDVELMLPLLLGKDTRQAFAVLRELERLSEESDALYPDTARFADMVKSGAYAVRVRGFRLLCKQARWDTENVLDRYMEDALSILEDEKPTAVRQALTALRDVVPYKRALWPLIRQRAEAIDVTRYKDTMWGLLEKDVQELLDGMEEGSC